jgi:hypothetical protein
MKITGHKRVLILVIVSVLLVPPLALNAIAQDSVYETSKLIVNDSEVGRLSQVGYSTAIDDDTVVVGAPFAGAAYVFSRTDEGWDGGSKLTVDDGSLGYGWSTSVGGDGNIAVVGAPFTGGGTGAVYVFSRTDEGWDDGYPLTADGAFGFGYSVSINDTGDTLVVGAPGSGETYVFTRTGDTWNETPDAILMPDGDPGFFGGSVAIYGNTVVVGAPSLNPSNSGKTYVFTRTGDTWNETPDKTLSPDGFGAVPYFGRSVAISDKTVVVGAPSAFPPAPPVEPGSVHVFSYNETLDQWNQDPIPPLDASGLGSSVAISGNRIVAGAASDNVIIQNPEEMQIDTAGSAYLLRGESNGEETEWVLEAKLVASDADVNERFGWAVAVDGSAVAIGASYADGMVEQSGAAYVYDFPPAEEPPLVEILADSEAEDYGLSIAEVGAHQYIDRGYKIKSMSHRLEGSVLIATANNDKREDAPVYLHLKLNRSAELFVAYDKRGACRPPSWLKKDGWVRTNEYIKTSDWPASPLVVFKRSVTAGERIILEGNRSGGGWKARSNYFVMVKEYQEDIVTIDWVDSSRPYSLAGALKGARPYTDRPYRIKAISGSLKGGVLVCTANNDKRSRKEELLQLTINENANVFVIYDKRGARRPPHWLRDGWERTRAYIKTSYWPSSPMKVFKRFVEAGESIILGGNRSGGGWKAKSNYFVIVKKPEEKTVDIVEVSTSKKYKLSTARVCARPYIDRKYKIKKMSSELAGGVLVRTANDDKWETAPEHVKLALGAPADVYVCYDKRGADNLPDWLDTLSWESTDFFVKTTDRPASPLVVLKTHVDDAGELILGGNHSGYDTGARSNYFVIIKQ